MREATKDSPEPAEELSRKDWVARAMATAAMKQPAPLTRLARRRRS